MTSSEPLIIKVTRGDMVESTHRVHYAVVDGAGKVIESAGMLDKVIYGRSAIKPLLALPLVETGAADHFGLGEPEIALACASHNGEPRQVSLVCDWLKKIGLSSDDLECGPQAPSDAASRKDLILSGKAFGREHNNCSGKHTGFLTGAVFLGETTAGYINYEHTVQQRLLKVLEEMMETDLKSAPRGIDGCGIPVIAATPRQHAYAFAKLADGKALDAKRGAAAHRVIDAMMAEPYFVGGTKRYCTDFMSAFPGKAAIKIGAEGVYCASMPEQGYGLCLKVEDGASRAAEVALGHIMQRIGIISKDEAECHPELFKPSIKNWEGRLTGYVTFGDAAF